MAVLAGEKLAAAAGRLRASRRYAWLLVDQAVFALTNLLLNILFARWLSRDDFGLYAISFSGFILLTVVHWGIAIEPLLVQSSKVAADRVRSFVRLLISVHIWGYAGLIAASVVVGSIAVAVGARDIGLAIGVIGIFGGALLLLATTRRLCLVFLSPRISAQIGFLHLCLVIGTAWLAHTVGMATWLSVWAIAGSWSLLGASVIALLLLRRTSGDKPYTLRELLHFQRQFTGWGLISAACSWLRTDAIYVVLAHNLGLTAVAETRAIVTLNGAVPQVNSALNASWLVEFSRASHNRTEGRRQIWRQFALYSAGAVVVALGAFIVAYPLVRLVYGEKYASGAWLLPLFCLAFLLNGIENLLTSAMKATGRVRHGYAPQIGSSLIVFGAAMLLVPLIGIGGGVAAVLAGAVFGAGLSFMLYLQSGRRSA